MHLPTIAHIAPIISPIVSLIAGVWILIMPRFLNFIVALFLILNGLLGLAEVVTPRLMSASGGAGVLSHWHRSRHIDRGQNGIGLVGAFGPWAGSG
jgi:hypothetical protein